MHSIKIVFDLHPCTQAGGMNENEESIGYLDLLKILSQYGLHVKESGLIGRQSKQVSSKSKIYFTSYSINIYRIAELFS